MNRPVHPYQPIPTPVLVEPRGGGYKWVLLVVNLICFWVAAVEYIVFSAKVLPDSVSADLRNCDSYKLVIMDLDSQKSCRLVYILIIGILTMASAIACVTIASCPAKQSKGITLVLATIYFIISGVLLFILFMWLLVTFYQESSTFRAKNWPLMALMILNLVCFAAAILEYYIFFNVFLPVTKKE